jgi:hypothetical protein
MQVRASRNLGASALRTASFTMLIIHSFGRIKSHRPAPRCNLWLQVSPIYFTSTRIA